MTLRADGFMERYHSIGVKQSDKFCLIVRQTMVGCNLKDRIYKDSWLLSLQFFRVPLHH